MVTIDDLPRFSPWPARLLGLQRWQPRRKTREEILREYEQEKWGPILQRVAKAGQAVSVEEVDQWLFDEIPDSPSIIDGHLELRARADVHKRYLDLLEGQVTQHLPASALVELGAGYGSIILALACRASVKPLRLMAGELTASGRELIRRLAAAEKIDIEVGSCDLAATKITELAIPARAIILTSFATMYVSKLSSAFLEQLTAYRLNS